MEENLNHKNKKIKHTCYVCGEEDTTDNLILVEGYDDSAWAHPDCQEHIEGKCYEGY